MSLWKSSLIVTLFTLLGRITGYGRDYTISLIGGANKETDIVFLILTIPDLLINIFLAGGLSTTIIPKLKSLSKENQKLISGQISTMVALLFIALSLLNALNAEKTFNILAPGINYLNYEENILPLIAISICLPICALSGVINAVLNSKNIFIPGAISSTILNVFMILFSALGYLIFKLSIIWLLVSGYVFGVLFRFFIQFSYGYKYFKIYYFKERLLVDFNLLKIFLGNFGFTIAFILMPVISRSFASKLEEGSLSIFTYSYKLIHLPEALIMGSFSIVLLPYLTNNINNTEVAKIKKWIFLISLFVSIIGYLISPLIINLIFRNSNLYSDQIYQLGETTAKGLLFLMPMSLVTLYGIIYAAKKEALPLFLTGLVMLSVICILSPLLSNTMNLNGVIISYGMSYVCGLLFISSWDNFRMLFLNKRLKRF